MPDEESARVWCVRMCCGVTADFSDLRKGGGDNGAEDDRERGSGTDARALCLVLDRIN